MSQYRMLSGIKWPLLCLIHSIKLQNDIFKMHLFYALICNIALWRTQWSVVKSKQPKQDYFMVNTGYSPGSFMLKAI